MDFFKLYGNLLRFDGTNQMQRALPALEQRYIVPDERSLPDLVDYAYSLAKELRFIDLSGQAVGDWSAFFEELVPKTKKLYAPSDLETIINARGDWPPHVALFLVFLKLFKNLQDDLNELPQRHLRHYYEKELGLPRRTAVADQVHVIFEPAPNAKDILLPAGTVLDAGKDALGRPLNYVTQNELVVSAATVARQCRLVMETDLREHPRFFISDARSDKESTSWYTFGRRHLDLDAGQRFMTEAEIGFAIASPLLLMAEGKRSVSITANLRSQKSESLSGQHIGYALDASLTGEKGWMAPDRFSAELIPSGGGLILYITLSLEEAAGAVVPFSQALHGQGPVSSWPLLRLMLKGESGLYQKLNGLSVAHATLTVEVTGMRNLVLQNAEGLLKPDQPMPLFGSTPAIGSPFYIGSAEVFGKPLSSLTLKLDWNNSPPNLFEHYQAYFEPEAQERIKAGFTGKFTVDLGLLHDGLWIQPPSLGKRPLFGNEASTPKSTELDITHYAQDFGKLSYPKQASLAGLSRYNRNSRYGFLRLELSGPTRIDFNASNREPPFEAFGHQVFPQRYTDQVIAMGQLEQAKNQREWVKAMQASLANTVYITGTPTLGQTLTASNTLADPVDLSSITYQWLRNGEVILSATGATYTLIQADVGKAISVKASYIDGYSMAKNITSLATSPIANISEPPVLPNEPYTPTLAGFSLDYTATVNIIPDGRPAEEAFFTLGPFGYTVADGEAPARLVPDILGAGSGRIDNSLPKDDDAAPKDDAAAALYLGVEKLHPPANLSLLFQIDEGTSALGIEALKAGETQWSYLSGQVWRDFPPDGVLKDSTLGFQKPGLVVLSVGLDATTDHTPMAAGMVWLRALIRRAPESASRTLLLHAQAALAEFEPEIDTESGSLLFEASNLKDLPSFVAKLQGDSNPSTKPISNFAWGQFEPAAQQVLSDPDALLSQRQSTLLRMLNTIIQGKSIYDPTQFVAVVLRLKTQSLLKQNPAGDGLIRLNRCLLEDAYPQEIVRNPLTDYDDFLRSGLPAGRIKGLKTQITAIKKVSQPYASFDGRASEQDEEFFRRVSERLRHRNRAVTAWDLERLVLERFPEVFKVKCLPHSGQDGNTQAGEAALVIVPDQRGSNNINPLEPRAGAVLMAQIEDYAGSGLTTPFVALHIIHPVYERIRVFARVKFGLGRDPGYYSGKLNEDLVKFLSPWAYLEGEDIQFGARIYKSDILAFVEGREYVDYATDFRLYHSYEGPPRYGIGAITIGMDFVIRPHPLPAIGGPSIPKKSQQMEIGNDFVVGLDMEAAYTTQPQAILVSHRSHVILAIAGESSCTGTPWLSIGTMTVGIDFTVAT